VSRHITHPDRHRSSYIPLPRLGKSDFGAITAFRADEFFYEAQGLREVSSEATMRQRLDTQPAAFRRVVDQASGDFLRRVGAPIPPLAKGRTHKEGVSRTHMGCDVDAPMLAYLDQEGRPVEVGLREGPTRVTRCENR
jgi:hypothetical protein